MPVWERSGSHITTPTFPFVALDASCDFELDLVTETGENFDACYLCVSDPNYAGTVSARLAGSSEYRAIQALSDASCYLGSIEENTSYTVEFRMLLQSGSYSEGAYSIEVWFCHDDGAAVPIWLFNGTPVELFSGVDSVSLFSGV